MVTRTTTYDYEQSSESSRERHVLVPYSRMTDATPTLHDPAEFTGAVAGVKVTGTIIKIDATDSIAVVNVAKGAVYRHNVRDVLTYSGASEFSWRALNIGDPVFYDPSAAMPAYTKLSISPLNASGTANTMFGWIVMMQDEDVNDFPKGTGLTPGSTHVCAILQV
jgi:hypothetical protein